MDLAPLIESGDWPAVAMVLDTLLHPQQEMKYRVELLVLGSLSCVTALIYICTFVHEVIAKRRTNQLWFFRFIDDKKGRYLTPNALLLWLPLGTLYCVVAAVAVFWRSKNDFYATGTTQKGLFALALLPSIPLGLAGYWVFSSILLSAIQMVGSVRGRGHSPLAMPNVWLYHFMVYAVPAGLFTTGAALSLVANARYNIALTNAAFLVDAIARADFENPLFEQNLVQFGLNANSSRDMVKDCLYIATADTSLQVILFFPASIIIFLAVRKSFKLRQQTTTGGSASKLAKMQKLLVLFICYSFTWVIAIAIFHYLSLAQVVSDNVGTSYRKDVLINFWIHAAGTGCAAVFLCFRSFVAKEDAPDSMGTQTNHKTTFGKSSNHPLQILTRTEVITDGVPSSHNGMSYTTMEDEKDDSILDVKDMPFRA